MGGGGILKKESVDVMMFGVGIDVDSAAGATDPSRVCDVGEETMSDDVVGASVRITEGSCTSWFTEDAVLDGGSGLRQTSRSGFHAADVWL